MLIINCGISRVVCERRYHVGAESEELLRQAGLKLEYMLDGLQQYDNQ
jgi:dCMP deaminase